MKKLLKVKFAWFPVWSVALLMLSMISIYLPVFGGADQKLKDFPLIVVNEDKDFTSTEFGKTMLNNLTEKQDGHSFKWTVDTSKEKAVEAIKNNKAYGAFIIPANFSGSISDLQKAFLSGETPGKAAQVEILINEGGGQLATSVATSVLQTITSTASTSISGQFKDEMIKRNIQVSPTSTTLLDQPIQATTTNVLGLPANLNKGMSPFMLVLIASITGLMGTQMIHGYLNKISEGLRSKGHALSHSKVLLTEMLLGVILSVLVASFLQLAVFGFFGSTHSTSIWPIFFFTLLCILTMLFMFKMIGIFLGKWAMLAMFPLNILGIFGSGGAVPITSLPEFHRIMSTVLPTRYMVDGMRSLFYYNGSMEAGLGTALTVISIYLVIFLGVCLTVLIRTYKKEKPTKSTPYEQNHNSIAMEA